MISEDDICLNYICVECYTEHQIQMQVDGTSDIVYTFDSDNEALQHLDDSNEPAHSLAYRVVRKPAETQE